MRSAARMGIRSNPFVPFDPLLIDGFNRANGALGTAYNGQTWSTAYGSPVISGGKFTSANASMAGASITTTGTLGNLSISMDIDPSSSALGDQAYVVADFFRDPATPQRYLMEISQRNWYFIYFDAAGAQTIVASGSPGYTYSTPFRLYITAQYLGGVVYYNIENSNLTGGARTSYAKGSHWYQVASGTTLQIECAGGQTIDNLKTTLLTLPTFTTANLGTSSSFSYDVGSTDMLMHYTIATWGGSSGPQQWGVSHVRMLSGNFNKGYRHQWSDSTTASDYVTKEDNGQTVLGGQGDGPYTAALGQCRIQVVGTVLKVQRPTGFGGQYTANYPSIDSNTFVGIATTNRSTMTNISGMAL